MNIQLAVEVDEDQSVEIKKSEVIEILRDLEMIVVSLERIRAACPQLDRDAYDRVVSDFMRQWDVPRRLEKARRMLSRHFSTSRDQDNMDELAREMVDVSYWSWSDRQFSS